MDLTRRGLIAGTGAFFIARPSSAQAHLLLRATEADIPLGDVALKTPAFNGNGIGQLLQTERGKPFTFRIENALDFEFVFRAQGLRGKSVAGGDTPIKPGETREITITPPDPGTFAYCAAGEGGLHVTRTVLLSGALVVTAEQPHIADRDIPVAVNTLAIPDADDAKPPRRLTTVNGVREIKLTARPKERLRLRLANLAQEAVTGIRLPEGTQVISIDGQPCEPFPPFDDVMFLPPLGRADILLNVPVESVPLTIVDALDTVQALVTIAVDGKAMPDRFLAKQLPNNLSLPKEIPLQSATRVTWKPGEVSNDPLANVKKGASVVLTFENNATPHALMLQGLTARLLDSMDDGWKAWWHDTLLVHENESARLAFVGQESGRYAVHMIPLEGNGAPTRAFIEVT